jgi:ribosomal protein L30E
MKKLILSVLIASVLMACNQPAKTTTAATTTTANAANAPVMKFEFESHDFGKLKQGDKVTYEFKFTNTGKSPLIITNATATCGCTTPEWPKAPLQPGEGGKITVTFNSAAKSGLQDKLITITANTNPAQNQVHLIGEVTTK